jgi:hypothetical protein
MATTLRFLHRNALVVVLFVLFLIPTHDSLAQIVCDPLVGLCTNESPTEILQQTENDLQNENSTFQQTANELNNAESSLRAIYGATAYSDCYEQSSACSEDTATQLGASECVDALQSCLEESAHTMQEYQIGEAQNAGAQQAQAVSPAVPTLQTGCLFVNAAGQPACTCSVGYVMGANGQCVATSSTPVVNVAPQATQPSVSQPPPELEDIGRISKQTIEIRNIPIPRLMLTPHYGELVITDFDLDAKKLSRFATDASILEQSLQGKEETDLFGVPHSGNREMEITRVSSLGEGRAQSPENTILAALVEEPLVDYDDPNQTSLLLKLTKQAVDHYRSFVNDTNALKMMVENNFRHIAKEIYDQILTHKEFKSESYLESGIREARPYLEQYNISRTLDEKPVTLDSQIDRFSREKIYTEFKKACHSMYKFDSSDEARMAYLLDKDTSVECWLRPAPNQFEGLYWRDEAGNSQHRYEPDFVAEFDNEIVIIEVKPSTEINNADVQEKKKTADKYCELVSMNMGKYKISKPWRYSIVPTEKITISSTVGGLLDTA